MRKPSKTLIITLASFWSLMVSPSISCAQSLENRVHDAYSELRLPSVLPSDDKVLSIHRSFGADNFLVSSSGILRISPGDSTFSIVERLPIGNQFLKIIDTGDRRALAIRSDGVERFDGVAWTGVRINPDLNVIAGVDDPAFGLWITTWNSVNQTSGIARLVDQTFNEVKTEPLFNKKLTTDIKLASDGALWIQLEDGAVFRYANGVLNPAIDSAQSALKGSAGHMIPDSAACMWVRSKNKSALKLCPKGKTVELSDYEYSILERTPKGRLLGGGAGDRLSVLSPPSAFVSSAEDPHDAIDSNDSPSQFSETPNGDLWVGTVAGEIARVQSGLVKFHRLRGRVQSIAQSEDGAVWAGTSEGLFRFNGRRWFEVDNVNLRQANIKLVIPRAGGGILIQTLSSKVWSFDPPNGFVVITDAAYKNYQLRASLSNAARVGLAANWKLYYTTSDCGRSIPGSAYESVLAKDATFDARFDAILTIPSDIPDPCEISIDAVSPEGVVLSIAPDDKNRRIYRFQTAGQRVPGAIVNLLEYAPLMWVALLLFYPLSSSVRLLLFWNASARKLFSLWIFDLAVYRVSAFRRYLLNPFRKELMAGLLTEWPEFFYVDLLAVELLKDGSRSERGRLTDQLQSLAGQQILEGYSGSGKTYFLSALALTSREIIIYLEARNCSKGVIAAVARKLPLMADDLSFVEKLLYFGGVGIIIDGLNEVDADTRLQVSLFLERFHYSDVLITTQPISWKPPHPMRRWEIQSLTGAQLRRFLIYGKEDEVQYVERVDGFMSKYVKGADAAVNDVSLQMLSTPYDLTIVRDLLSKGIEPDLAKLYDQPLRLAEQSFREETGRPLPIRELSEAAYKSRVTDSNAIENSNLDKVALDFLAQSKILLSRPFANGAFIFRHDKVQDVFILKYFHEWPGIQAQFSADPRFAGVFVLLAEGLQPAEAIGLLAELGIRGAAADEFGVLGMVANRLAEIRAATEDGRG